MKKMLIVVVGLALGNLSLAAQSVGELSFDKATCDLKNVSAVGDESVIESQFTLENSGILKPQLEIVRGQSVPALIKLDFVSTFAWQGGVKMKKEVPVRYRPTSIKGGKILAIDASLERELEIIISNNGAGSEFLVTTFKNSVPEYFATYSCKVN